MTVLRAVTVSRTEPGAGEHAAAECMLRVKTVVGETSHGEEYHVTALIVNQPFGRAAEVSVKTLIEMESSFSHVDGDGRDDRYGMKALATPWPPVRVSYSSR